MFSSGLSGRAPLCRTKASAAWPASRRCSVPDRRRSNPSPRRPAMIEVVARPVDGAHTKYQRLVELAQQQPTIMTAVAHPCDDVSLESVVEAARLGLIETLL